MGMMVYEAVRRIFNNPRRLIVNMLKHQMGDHLLIIYTEGWFTNHLIQGPEG